MPTPTLPRSNSQFKRTATRTPATRTTPRQPKPRATLTPEEREAQAIQAAWQAIAATIDAKAANGTDGATAGALALDYVAVNRVMLGSPHAEPLKALEAAVKHGTAKQCKTLLAAQPLFDSAGNGQHFFQVPSVSHPGDFYRVRMLNRRDFCCPCAATGECWHVKAARNVAALLWPEMQAAPESLVQIEQLTDAAFDMSDDLSDAQPEHGDDNDDDDYHGAPRVPRVPRVPQLQELPALRDFEISKFSPTLSADVAAQQEAGRELMAIICRKAKAHEDAHGVPTSPEWYQLSNQWDAVQCIGCFPDDATGDYAAAAAREHAPHLLEALRVKDTRRVCPSDNEPDIRPEFREAMAGTATVDYVGIFED